MTPARAPALAILASGLMLASSAFADVEVRLASGRVLRALSASRVGDTVVVQTAASTMRIPAKNVAAIVPVAASERPVTGAGLNLPVASRPVADTPGDSTGRLKLSVTSVEQGASADQLRTLLVDDPTNADLRLALGQALIARGSLSEALKELALIPSDASRWLRVEQALALSRALTQLDRPREALAALDAAPQDPRITAARAVVARDASDGQDSLASTHFRVHFPPGTDRFDTGPLLDELERVHATIEASLGPGPTEPIVVLLYPGNEFWEATGQGSNVSGLFDGKIRVPAGRLMPMSPTLSKVLRHETTHAFIHVIAKGRASVGWHEGLAEHFEGDDIASTMRALEAAARHASQWPPPLTHEVAHARMEWFLSRRGMATAAEILRRTAMRGEAEATRAATGMSVAELDEAWRQDLLEARR